jgi:pyruvate/2-oxoglutarate dehydrogenase complex dihydrolipoamide acyltransferase (E2) component
MEDGIVAEWLKAEGDTVAEGDPLVEIEAAKANETVEAPVAGVLTRIVAAEGETVPVREVIAIIETA